MVKWIEKLHFCQDKVLKLVYEKCEMTKTMLRFDISGQLQKKTKPVRTVLFKIFSFNKIYIMCDILLYIMPKAFTLSYKEMYVQTIRTDGYTVLFQILSHRMKNKLD